MRFADPGFLFALVLILIPILIHFFHFKRYKTVYFSQVGFLKTIKQNSKKKRNLKQLLILFSRIFAISFLVLAFAQPYLPLNKQETKASRQLVGIYVDNSFSMKKMNSNGILLEVAKNKAVDIVNSYGPGVNFILLNNSEGNTEQQQLLAKEQAIPEIAGFTDSPNAVSLSTVVRQFQNRINQVSGQSEASLYILSDFQRYSSNLNDLDEDPNLQIYLVPFSADNNNNLVVDTCWFESPGRRLGQNEILHVNIRNISDETYQNIPVRLEINDTLKAVNSITITPQETVELELNYQNNRSGIYKGKVEIDDFPIVFDNSFYFSYEVKDKVNVLVIYNPDENSADLLSKLFSDDDNISLTEMDANRLQLSSFNKYQCIYLLNLGNLSNGLIDALNGFSTQGGTLCIFPGENIETESYNQLYRQLHASAITGKDTSRLEMDVINYQNLLFNNVFLREDENIELPYISDSYRFQSSTNSFETRIITNNNGSSALSEYPVGLGKLYNFSFSLNTETSDFYRQALFVPVVYNIALNSYEPQTIQYTLSKNNLVEIKRTDVMQGSQFITITNEQGAESQLPVLAERPDYIRINPGAFTSAAGFYSLSINNQLIKILSYNYDRSESLSDYYSTEELEDISSGWTTRHQVIEGDLPDFQRVIESINSGTELWKYAILLSLLFLLIEVLIIRFWK